LATASRGMREQPHNRRENITAARVDSLEVSGGEAGWLQRRARALIK